LRVLDVKKFFVECSCKHLKVPRTLPSNGQVQSKKKFENEKHTSLQKNFSDVEISYC